MITLTTEDVKRRFGTLFAEKFLVMVDERAGLADIIERFHARGTIERDAMNRHRAGGGLTKCLVEGTTKTVHAKLGRFPINFGAAANDIGGQALEGVEFLNMRLVELNPEVPQKTTNCVGSALNFAVKPETIEHLKDYFRTFIESHTFSEDIGIVDYRGLSFMVDSPVFKWVKTEILTLEQAEREAQVLGIEFLDNNARKGRIGALGAVLWANRGIEAAGLYGEHL